VAPGSKAACLGMRQQFVVQKFLPKQSPKKRITFNPKAIIEKFQRKNWLKERNLFLIKCGMRPTATLSFKVRKKEKSQFQSPESWIDG
jgi:hypothetical protein